MTQSSPICPAANILRALLPSGSKVSSINLQPIGSGVGILASGGVDLIGSTSPSSVVAAFSVDHSNFALESIEVEAQLHLPQALGWIPGPNVDLSATSGAFVFPEAGLLDGGSSTDIFYVAYADLLPGEQLTFTLTPVDDAEAVAVAATVVPEPSTHLMLALGLGILTFVRRRPPTRCSHRPQHVPIDFW